MSAIGWATIARPDNFPTGYDSNAFKTAHYYITDANGGWHTLCGNGAAGNGRFKPGPNGKRCERCAARAPKEGGQA